MTDSRVSYTDPNEHELAREVYRQCEAILRAYGVDYPTQVERRAYVGVLDRMGAFAPSERAALSAGGFL